MNVSEVKLKPPIRWGKIFGLIVVWMTIVNVTECIGNEHDSDSSSLLSIAPSLSSFAEPSSLTNSLSLSLALALSSNLAPVESESTLPKELIKSSATATVITTSTSTSTATSAAISTSTATSTTTSAAISTSTAKSTTTSTSTTSTATSTTISTSTSTVISTSTIPTTTTYTVGSSIPPSVGEEIDQLDQFLSFEEWRKRNLEKSGQSESDLTPRQQQHLELQSHKSPNEVESNFIDDDLEIDIGMFQRSSSSPIEEPNDATSEGKLYKQRFNYASFDCAAAIMKSNSNAKGVSNILNENKDTYLLNKCSEQNKFFIVELCQDILVNEVSIANYEFFSSMFRKIRISVADSFPVPASSWKVLGEFEAKSVRDIQSFHIDNPLIWARYLRIEVLSHWGREYYCPISLVRVHGTTMMDEYRNQEGILEKERKNIAGEGLPIKSSTTSDSKVVPDPVADTKESAELSFSKPLSSEISQPTLSNPTPTSSTPSSIYSQVLSSSQDSPYISNTTPIPHLSNQTDQTSSNPVCDPSPLPRNKLYDQFPPLYPGQLIFPLVLNESCQLDEYINNHTISRDKNTTFPTTTNLTASTEHNIQNNAPKTQDSIYQTIMKRLSLLESNTTLSLQYVEMQSQSLRDLLVKIEKKQSSRIEAFFQEFNQTVSDHIRSFQFQYSRLLLSTVDEMEAQRRRTDEDLLALSTRLSLIADELIYQKKLSIVQAVILLIVLLFVITTRATPLDSSLAMALHGNRSGISGLWGLTTSVMSSPTLIPSPKRRRSKSRHWRGHSNSSAEWYDDSLTDGGADEDHEESSATINSDARTPKDLRRRNPIKFPLPKFSRSPRPHSLPDLPLQDAATNEEAASPNLIIDPESETDNDINSPTNHN